MPTYYTEKDAIITVSLAGVTFPSTILSWKTFEGGDPTADTGQLQPGGTVKSVARPGVVTRSNVTVTLPYSLEIDSIRSNIENAVNGSMTASYTPLDGDGNPSGNTTTRTGLMKEPQLPKWDSGSSDNTMFGLVMECNT
jgi:hypothetical protein